MMKTLALPQEGSVHQCSREERRAQIVQLRYDEALAMARRRWPAIAAVADEHPFVEAAVLAKTRSGNSVYLNAVRRWFAYNSFQIRRQIADPEQWPCTLLTPEAASAAAVFCFLVHKKRSTVVIATVLLAFLMGMAVFLISQQTENHWHILIGALLAALSAFATMKCTVSLSVLISGNFFRGIETMFCGPPNAYVFRTLTILIAIVLGTGFAPVLMEALAFFSGILALFLLPEKLDYMVNRKFSSRIERDRRLLYLLFLR